MGQMPSSIITEREKSFKVNVETVMPSVGVPLAIEQVALVKGTDKKDEALKFIDWFGSAKTQGEWAQQFNSMPVNKAAVATGQARGRRVLQHAQAAGHRLELRAGEHGRLGGKDRTGIHELTSGGLRPAAGCSPALSVHTPAPPPERQVP